MRKILKNKFIAYILSIFCMFLWGSAFPTIKVTYRELNISNSNYFEMIFVAGIRFFIAGILVFIFMSIFDKKSFNQIKPNFAKLITIALIVISFGYFFFYIGTGNTTGMKSSLITSMSTFLVVIFSHFFLHEEQFNKFKLLAIILGIVGVIITNINKEFNFNFKLTGEGFLLLNAILNGYGTVYVKKYLKDVSPFVVSGCQFLFGSIFLILVGFIGMDMNIIFTPKSIILLFYGGIISSVAFTIWYFILREYKASEISFLRLFIPFFGTFLSAIILDEDISISIILGVIFVIFGIIIINKSSKLEKLTKEI